MFAIAAGPLAAVAVIGWPVWRGAERQDRIGRAEQVAAAAPLERLSVLSYNVEGLPPPARWGRTADLARIARELSSMRQAGEAPHVVMLQESFIDPDPPIETIAGYRYVAHGPAEADRSPPPAGEAQALAAEARTAKGEGVGQWVDSGLRVLSDFPIVRVRRMAFPAWMCAGYDCLASKGVLVAWIAVPGSPRSVAFVNTHLNSMRLAGVSPERSDLAFALQVAAMRRFLAETVPADAPAFFGGDFDTENERRRRLLERPPISGARDALWQAFASSTAIAADELPEAAAIRAHGVDRLYYRDTVDWPVELETLTVPFGARHDGTMLSDHRGFVVRFRVGSQRDS
ncbi:endonuclease/exonuclease/phosphatase family protein [Tsuneonella sp. SYSU-LHT278]|uniref:endonuclease/exonuclease/phosphatase family protein n=1 Tax=Tsuneonella sediminis TaxID=3416089 RepID=UPI003F799FF5